MHCDEQVVDPEEHISEMKEETPKHSLTKGTSSKEIK